MGSPAQDCTTQSGNILQLRVQLEALFRWELQRPEDEKWYVIGAFNAVTDMPLGVELLFRAFQRGRLVLFDIPCDRAFAYHPCISFPD